jgi:hypothetical protein
MSCTRSSPATRCFSCQSLPWGPRRPRLRRERDVDDDRGRRKR